MKTLLSLSSFAFILILIGFVSPTTLNHSSSANMQTIEKKDSLLRHVVLFKFKEGTSKADISKVETAFSALPNNIPEIMDYEWGLNNSPEGINKGFTHCFLVTFNSEEARAIYLPHPAHKAFVDVLSPHLEDVVVVDYWAQ
ncbi:Dabb family protein [Arenibacter amylolyticus]|uniref:Dabb family protein n=1 Tax=Arenibacter amylolyticus TaxID=1406873 RepID=UPI000A388D6A|nr:Dabb family protein [Arenibacter amylolyticus]